MKSPRKIITLLIVVCLGSCVKPKLSPSPSPSPSPSAISRIATRTPFTETPELTTTEFKPSQEPTTTPSITPSDTSTVLPPSPSPTSSYAPGKSTLLGHSTNNYPINTYRFGDGPKNLVLIGGIHGGYEWNTILLAYKAIDFFNENPEFIPPEFSLYIIPSANPDGLAQVIGHAGRFTPQEVGTDTKAGRFNGAEVDLNRNWNCNWSPTATWQDQEILAGTEPFSEIETKILKDFLVNDLPADLVIFWHSAAFGVYGAGCGEVYQSAADLAYVYAEASGYTYHEIFTSFAVTGDATDWLATVEIPAITVELTNHFDLDWERNVAAIIQVMEQYK